MNGQTIGHEELKSETKSYLMSGSCHETEIRKLTLWNMKITK